MFIVNYLQANKNFKLTQSHCPGLSTINAVNECVYLLTKVGPHSIVHTVFANYFLKEH